VTRAGLSLPGFRAFEEQVSKLAAIVALIVATLTACLPARASEEEFAHAIAALAAADSYADKTAAATAVGASRHPRAEAVLAAMLEGQLYTTRAGSRLVTAAEVDGGYAIRDAVTDEDLGTVGRREVSRVSLNNQLRATLRSVIAGLRLTHEDPAERRAAIQKVGESSDLAMVETLEQLLTTEENARVRDAIEMAIATLNLESPDNALRLAAIEKVGSNVSAHVRSKLTALANNAALDEELRAAAKRSLDRIEQRVAFYELVQTAFFGLSLGSVLVLAAIGLSVTFGIMGVINMAHGELMMLGAYTTYVVQLLMPNAIGASLFVAMPLAFLVAALAGIAIERGIVRTLYARPLETLLATFGVSLVLQQTVRTVFSPLNRTVVTPDWLAGSIEIVPGLAITLNRLYILLFSLLVFAALLLVLRYTRFGLEMRAVTQNRAMARAMGVRTDRIDALTFGLGAGIAGLAGVALSQLTNVGPNLGQAYIVDSFMVVVFGGVGSLWGTLTSGLTLGVVSKLIEPAAGAVMAKIFVLVFLIVFIQKRPRGLFPQKGRAAEG
jgi:urea transport system permease protein